MKLNVADFFTNMAVSEETLVHPNCRIRIKCFGDGSVNFSATLVSGIEFTVHGCTLAEAIALFNSKWTLGYVKKW